MGDLFTLLEKNEDEQVEFSEFKGLMERLNLGISELQIEQLFAYCDVDASGFISEKELTESWEYLVSTLMEAAAETAGVGNTEIVLVCALIITWLVLLFAFIFL